MTAESDCALEGAKEFALEPQSNATSAAPASQIRRCSHKVVESGLVVDHELEHTQLLPSATLDERSRMRECEPNKAVALIHQERVTQPKLAREVDLARVVVAGKHPLDQRTTLGDGVVSRRGREATQEPR